MVWAFGKTPGSPTQVSIQMRAMSKEVDHGIQKAYYVTLHSITQFRVLGNGNQTLLILRQIDNDWTGEELKETSSLRSRLKVPGCFV
jgi:hypothetical protein